MAFPGSTRDRRAIDAIRHAARPVTTGDEAEILRFVGDAPLVLLGEATHGTHDFYEARAQLTRRLIADHGFTAVAIEGDWPDAYRVNRYVQGMDGWVGAADALGGFIRFPTWMWRNLVVKDFVEWLRHHNAASSDPAERAGFYGLDLYSLHASMQAVIDYLDRVDPVAARGARHSYGCFDQFGADPESYAWAATQIDGRTCEDAALQELLALRQRREDLLLTGTNGSGADEYFYAEQNARLVRNAESYYRSMFRGRAESWNIRDRHMAETLEELRTHLVQRGVPPKVVVWAHNSHLGDARATAMGDSGELNLGQLVRERYPGEARLIGFTTFSGSVIAASDWGSPAERKTVRPALGNSYEHLMHSTGMPRFFLPLDDVEMGEALAERRLERAIGVIYRPATERQSHYFEASLAQQFDAILHFDHTRALTPLERVSVAGSVEVPETYPTGV
jgi:erythromycin esterase-like protein